MHSPGKRWKRKRKQDKRRVALIPVFLTLGNLSFGLLAILSTFEGHFKRAGWFIVIGLVLDGLDGWVARTTRTASGFGMQLDSLADVITFGAAPSLLLYHWVLSAGTVSPARPFAIAMTLFYTACVAIRLARFNLTYANSDVRYFFGLPSPSAALMVSTIILNFNPPEHTSIMAIIPLALLGVLGVLMVSNIRYRSSKALEIHRRWPFASYAFVALFIAMLASYHKVTLFVMAILYVLSGPVRYAWLNFIKRTVHETEIPHPDDQPLT